MLAIGLLVAAGALMWVGQSAILLLTAQPVRLRLSSEGMSKGIRQASRVVTNLSIAGVVVAYPLARGQDVLAYYARLLPLDHRASACLKGFSIAVFYLALMYLAWLATDNVRFRVRHGAGRLARRLAAVPLSAAFGALAEELLFRGVLLADLLESLEPVPAVMIATVLFAAAHYVRRVKRYWTLAGHLAMSGLLCATFVWTRTLWLPIGLHAGGIFLTLGTRPFVRYIGPGWLVGASIFPYAGAVGILALALLTIAMGMSYGG